MPRFLILLAALVAAPLAAQTTHVITVDGLEFTPQNLTIEAGDTVTWDNVGGFHNVDGNATDYPSNPEGFSSGDPEPAPWMFSFTFTMVGDYDYHCDVHGSPGVGMIGSISVTQSSSSEGEPSAESRLSVASPNPFRDATEATLTLAASEVVRVAVYDVLGRELTVLHDGRLPAGVETAFRWAPTSARSGLYVIRAHGETFRAFRKVVRAR